MTNNEKELLDQLKDFFTKKYDEGSWEKEFKKYTNKLVADNHLDKEVIDEYLNDESTDTKELDEIVKRYASFVKRPRTSSSSSSSSYGCGSSPRSSGSGCGSSPRSNGSGCGGSGSYSRSSC